MTTSYSSTYWVLGSGLLLICGGRAFAQAPAVTAVSPLANARAATRTSPLVATFSQPLTAASVQALKVFSSQRGGLRTRGATPAVVSGNTLSFTPAIYPFMPGETVQYTTTPAATSSSGVAARPRVGQFTVAAGAGGGNFQPGTACGVGYLPDALALGDVDGDGDLDLLAANNAPAGTVSICLNDGTGTFGSSRVVSVGSLPNLVKLGDLDGDGDLDLLTSNTGNISLASTVSIRLNDGTGIFSGSQELPVGRDPGGIALGDSDGDGDLDLFVANGSDGTVNIRLNNGSGAFTGSQNLSVGAFPLDLLLGDLDSDGDLDLLVANGGNNELTIRLNDGSGQFATERKASISSAPGGLVLGDVDGDNDLDLLATNIYSNSVSVRLNDGSGNFGGSQEISVGRRPRTIRLGDVEGDGDFDALVENENSTSVTVLLNDGNGAFRPGQDVSSAVVDIALGDVDSDGDLDFVTVDVNPDPYMSMGTARVMLNKVAVLAAHNGHPATTLTLFPNPAHGATTLTGLAPHTACTLLDALGRPLLTSTADAAGAARLQLPAGLPAGLYLVRYGSMASRLIVQ